MKTKTSITLAIGLTLGALGIGAGGGMMTNYNGAITNIFTLELLPQPLATNITFVDGQVLVEYDKTIDHHAKNLVLHAHTNLVENLVNRLVSSGEFCRVRGHTWSDSFGWVTTERDTDGSVRRRCAVCLTIQTRTPGEWK